MDATSEAKLAEVNPALAQLVRQMSADVASRGGSLRVVSGFRSYQQQAALYANRGSNPNPVAAPGTSLHEQGLAVDLSWSGVSESYVGQLGESLGLRWGGRFTQRDPGHFELTSDAARGGGSLLNLNSFGAEVTQITQGLDLGQIPQTYIVGAVVFVALLLIIRR